MATTNVSRCDGFRRREILRLGCLAPLGLGLGEWLAQRAYGNTPGSAKACILLWLDGGPSHLETFDLKPDAPSEVRGPLQPIRTNVPGIEICELLPRTATLMDKVTLIRSMTSPLGEHGLANQYLLSGYKPSPVLNYPSMGSVVSATRTRQGILPDYIAIPEAKSSAGAGFLGSIHEPFVTGGDPSKSDFRVNDLSPYHGVTVNRLRRRQEFLGLFDQSGQIPTNQVEDEPAFAQAFRLVTSTDAKTAFDLGQESPSVRARYGPRTLGQSCLLARRLVERGVPFVTVFDKGWDTHEQLTLRLRDGYTGAKVGVGLIPTFDLAFAALIEDLDQRGMLEETLVVAMGEFGRTPKVNTRGGRDHWPRVFSIAMAGGGIRGGQVIGASDRVGESPHDNPVTPADLAHSLYSLLGVDPNQELHTPDGRPVPVNQGGQRIPGLV